MGTEYARLREGDGKWLKMIEMACVAKLYKNLVFSELEKIVADQKYLVTLLNEDLYMTLS